jgi:predicted transcriptional regulator
MLRDSRRREGLTEAQVAHRIGVSVTTYRRFEAGGQRPTVDVHEFDVVDWRAWWEEVPVEPG